MISKFQLREVVLAFNLNSLKAPHIIILNMYITMLLKLPVIILLCIGDFAALLCLDLNIHLTCYLFLFHVYTVYTFCFFNVQYIYIFMKPTVLSTTTLFLL